MITVVGMGADGWPGLTGPARAAVLAAEVLLGSGRQLALIPPDIPARRIAWVTPLLPSLPGLLEEHRDQRVCVLASGDPLYYGVGTTLIRLLGADRVHVLPHPSSVSLACARLGWAQQDTEVVSVVGRPVDRVTAALQPGRRVLVLSEDGTTPAAVAALLVARGYPASRLTVLAELGGPAEEISVGVARDGMGPAPALNILAVECDPAGPGLSTVPGRPDDTYANDGQLTKREIRAVTLARLAPLPGELLWDVGAGAGSIGIEWLRTHRSCRAVAVERSEQRAFRVRDNAKSVGVPQLEVVIGPAPASLAGLPAPDAVFIGGGVTVPGVVEACWAALRPGGRLVVNAVTLESEQTVAGWYARLGGDLTRIAVSRAAPVGGFTGWRSSMPVTQWVVEK